MGKAAGKILESPAFVLAFLTLLALPQAAALALQFQHGFRPFQVAPGRITLSWDMFATRIERCGLSWNPALPTEQGPVFEFAQLSRIIEWQPVYDTGAAYENFATWTCSRYHQPFHAVLHCFLPDGKETVRVIECR